jgi:Na+-transporting NADH:ubiquinone oxidoreductase subunit NqrB
VLPRPDPRHYQIAVLTALLAYGLMQLDFEIGPTQAVAMLATALATQYVCAILCIPASARPAFDPRSALISGLSLCLLLRTSSLGLTIAAAVIAVASKFLIRIEGKHVFNPTNLAIVAMLLTGDAWVSPGQWGNVAFFAFLMACLGGLVVIRAARSDVTISFVVFYMVLVLGRSLWLGEPMSIPIHRLQSGALLLFTFFMISDPKTTPSSRAGRILFALLVACGAWYVQFRLFRTNGLLWSLAACSMTVPLIDRLLPGRRYEWSRPGIGSLVPREVSHETSGADGGSGGGMRVVESHAAGLLRFLRIQG